MRSESLKRSLSVCARSSEVLKLLLPTVEILSLDLTSEFCEAIIPVLPTSAPRLNALEIKGSPSMTNKNLSEIKSLLISYPHGLTELSLICQRHDIPSTVLNIIAPWPSLRSLTLKLGLKSIPTAPLHNLQPFAALAHLHILFDNTLDRFISFLRAFQILNFNSSNNHSITSSNLNTIQFNVGGCSSANTWSEFLPSLLHTNTKLEHLIINETCNYQCLPPSSFDFRPIVMHPSLAHISTLRLSPGRTISIMLTDSDILTLARRCPHLHILDLGLRSTPVSLYALNVLVRRCRELSEVTLCMDVQVDALRDDEKPEDEIGLQPNTHLTKLEIGDSPVVYAGSLRSSPELTMSIPQFLHAMAPRLKSVKDGAWSNGTYESPWKVVSYALQMMVTEEGGVISDRKPHPLDPQISKRRRHRHRVTGAALEKSNEEGLSDSYSMSTS
ncbi:hypothetical protein DFJ58DRAFT_731888 [Suillus subalutaceus]|uniref:uncharacterized protein n=1 Tax=Suillus subalutaceus TaxID=48586 RepID=UPI001B86AA41|nr:uncharacterized protein DFJ58DRAFT_731888 [Suillus subalutaceus]KAG1842896.1 hypothetical protein DFJ58DRAFT_731888 [Suillus subalutaceus]